MRDSHPTEFLPHGMRPEALSGSACGPESLRTPGLAGCALEVARQNVGQPRQAQGPVWVGGCHVSAPALRNRSASAR